MRRRRPDPIPDALSPDRGTCEHCGQPIGWDDYSYTHMANGFATCGTTVQGGTRLGGVAGALLRTIGRGIIVNPEIVQDPAYSTSAEPTTWYEDVAA